LARGNVAGEQFFVAVFFADRIADRSGRVVSVFFVKLESLLERGLRLALAHGHQVERDFGGVDDGG
jgi:hypothetical protein